jgi:hypothetical protein
VVVRRRRKTINPDVFLTLFDSEDIDRAIERAMKKSVAKARKGGTEAQSDAAAPGQAETPEPRHELSKTFQEVAPYIESPDKKLRAYAKFARGLSSIMNRLSAETVASVDTTGLKRLARDTLPLDSLLRRLIELEPDVIPAEEWRVKADVYRKLMIAETERLPSGSSS